MTVNMNFVEEIQYDSLVDRFVNEHKKQISKEIPLKMRDLDHVYIIMRCRSDVFHVMFIEGCFLFKTVSYPIIKREIDDGIAKARSIIKTLMPQFNFSIQIPLALWAEIEPSDVSKELYDRHGCVFRISSERIEKLVAIINAE